MYLEAQDFIQKLKSGDEESFGILVDRFQTRVYNTCLGFVFKQEDAEDLTQEVFLEVYRSIHNFEARAQLSTWIYRISVTKSLEFLRTWKRKKRAGKLLSLIGLQASGFDLKGDRLDHPGIRIENQELAKRLYGAIDSLPENQRTAFTLCKIDGRSYEEVAEIMQMSISSIESLLFRSRKNLKANLEKFYSEEF